MSRNAGELRIRRATRSEASALTELALRSKAYWGYSDDFMRRCRALLTVTSEYIDMHTTLVAESEPGVCGFCALREHDGELELDLLFVEPMAVGRGVGRRLLTEALRIAVSTEHEKLVVESDPQAAAFYARCGGVHIGERASPLDTTRRLPLLAFDLNAHRRNSGGTTMPGT